MTVRKPGWQRVADRLADGQWHSSWELATECSVMSHCRISDLRKDHGYVIESRRVSGAEGLHAFEYRLVSTPEAGGDRRASAAALFGVPPASGTEANVADSGCLPSEPTVPDYIEGQLSVFDALGAVA